MQAGGHICFGECFSWRDLYRDGDTGAQVEEVVAVPGLYAIDLQPDPQRRASGREKLPMPQKKAR